MRSLVHTHRKHIHGWTDIVTVAQSEVAYEDHVLHYSFKPHGADKRRLESRCYLRLFSIKRMFHGQVDRQR